MQLFFILALVPLALGAVPKEKRLFLETFIDTSVLKTFVNDLVHLVGTDDTEQACEGACHGLVVGDETALLHTFCPAICHSLQTLVHTLDHTATVAPGKRAFLTGLINITVLTSAVNGIVHLVGTDSTEQACEGACNSLVLGVETALIHTFCTPICRSLQTLVHTLDHTATVAPGKRAFLSGLFDTTVLSAFVGDLVHLVGTDSTEQACEGVCHGLVVGDETALIHTFCPVICRSLQTLVHTLDHTQVHTLDHTLAHTTTTVAPAKRAFLSGLFDTHVLSAFVGDLVHLVGSNPTEQACEGACHSIVVGPGDALIHTFCNPICRSLQSLALQFDHVTPTTTTTTTTVAPAKRTLFGSLIDTTVLSAFVGDLVHLVGSTPTEQACELACHSIVVGPGDALIHTLCTPICRSLQSLALHFDHVTTTTTTTTTTVAPAIL